MSVEIKMLDEYCDMHSMIIVLGLVRVTHGSIFTDPIRSDPTHRKRENTTHRYYKNILNQLDPNRPKPNYAKYKLYIFAKK